MKTSLLDKIYLFKLKVVNPIVYKNYLKFKTSQYWSLDDLKNHQFKMMKKVITFAYNNHDFYRELYDRHNLTPDDFNNIDDIKKFPLISKEQLKNGLKNNKFTLPGKVIWHSTSGSTGEPFSFPIDIEGEKIRKACKIRTEEWYGKSPGTKWLRIWRGSSKSLKSKLLDFFLARKIEITFYQIDKTDENLIGEEELQKFVDKINRSGAKVVDGYVSALTLIAEFAIRTKQKMDVQSVVTGAEYLSPFARKKIEEGFGAKVFNRYGGTEIGLMAHEGDDGAMYVMADRLYYESSQLDSSEETNEIIITDFTNMAMPFIRYRVGDLISNKTSDLKTYSNIKLPRINEIEGRSNDFFVLSDGRLLTSHIWHVYFRDKENVTRFQVMQLKDLSVQIKLETNGNADIGKITEELKAYVPGLDLSIEVVKNIPHEKNGKFRHTFSQVQNYENELNKRLIPPTRNISNINPYIPVSDDGIDPYSTLKLDWNESAIEVPESVKEVLITAINKPNLLNWYPPVRKEKLKKMIATYTGVNSENIEIFPGSDSAIEFLCKVFVRDGTVIGLVEPTYDQARLSFSISGALLKRYKFKNIFKPSFDEICSQISGNENIIYMSNPNNPTGFVWSKDELSSLSNKFPSILFIVDEAYIEFAKDGTCAPLINTTNNIIIVRTFSKGLALAGLRLGFLVFPEGYTKTFSKVLNVKDVNVLAIIAAEEILNNIEEMKQNIKHLIEGRDFAIKTLSQAGLSVVNGEANFFMLKSKNPSGLVRHLREEKVLVRSRDGYPGLEGYVRISSAAIDDMKRVVEEIIKYEN